MTTLARRIRKRLPFQLKPLLRRAYYLPIDVIEGLTGRRSDLVPPRRKMFVGDGDFCKTGREFLRYFIDLGGLQPGDRILDVGCGIGRMAVPLTTFLSPQGEYRGFDIVQEGIDWCQSRITSRFPNFQFQLADVRNDCYNPAGKYAAQAYTFPYPDDYFDFVFLGSVFTHMRSAAVRRYTSEIARVLKPGGRSLITVLLLNAESRQCVAAGTSTLNFKYEVDGGLTVNEDKPEGAIAYDEDTIRQLYRQHDCEVVEPIHYGSWCGRGTFLSYQDIIVAIKKPGAHRGLV